jgi:hypothetical protein
MVTFCNSGCIINLHVIEKNLLNLDLRDFCGGDRQGDQELPDSQDQSTVLAMGIGNTFGQRRCQALPVAATGKLAPRLQDFSPLLASAKLCQACLQERVYSH